MPHSESSAQPYPRGGPVMRNTNPTISLQGRWHGFADLANPSILSIEV